MASKKILDFLKKEKVHYEHIDVESYGDESELDAEQPTFSAIITKVVPVKLDNSFAMVLLPVHGQIDLERLAYVAEAVRAEILPETTPSGTLSYAEFMALPIGAPINDVDIYAERSIADYKRIAFRLGASSEMVILQLEDYIRMVRPVFARIAA